MELIFYGITYGLSSAAFFWKATSQANQKWKLKTFLLGEICDSIGSFTKQKVRQHSLIWFDCNFPQFLRKKLEGLILRRINQYCYTRSVKEHFLIESEKENFIRTATHVYQKAS